MEELMRENFDNYYLHHFFHKTYTNAKTGILKVYFDNEITKTVYFQEGNIVFASSNANKDKLVNILLKYKKVTQDQLEVVMKQMNKNISLGRNLVNMGFITHKELIWAVKVQIIGIIHSIIVQEGGKYSFQEEDLPEGVINLPLNTLKIIFDSLILFKDKEWIASNINAPESVFKKTILFEEGKNKLITSEDLLSLAETIDGEKHVGELADLTDMEDFKVFKLIYALKFLNLIEEKGSEEPVVTEELFEIEDEPEENLDLIREFSGQENDSEKDDELSGESPNIETDDMMDSDNSDFDEDDDSEKVFIEFDVDEETSIDLSTENEDDNDIEIIDSEPEISSGNSVEDEFKLTEDDLESVILDPEEGAEEEGDDGDFDSTQSEPDEEQSYDNNQTLISGEINVEDDSSDDLSEDKISDNEEDQKSPKGFLYFLIFILLLAICAVSYLYFFDNPILNLRNDSDIVKEVSGDSDVTQQEIGNLEGDRLTQDGIAAQNTDQNEQMNITETASENNTAVMEEPDSEKPSEKTDVITTDQPESAAAEVQPETAKEDNKPKTAVSSGNSPKKPESSVNTGGIDTEFAVYVESGKRIVSSSKNKYTIRIEFACMPDTVKTAIQELKSFENFYLIPQYRNSRTCYFVYLGVFDSEADAYTLRSQLPQIFFEGGNNPVVVQVSSIR